MPNPEVNALFLEIRDFCSRNTNPAIVKKYSKFFVEGYDAYGLDQSVLEPQRQNWLKAHKPTLGLDGFLELGDLLVAGGKFEEVFLAFWFVKRFEKEFTRETLTKMGTWLEKGISNWAETDTFSMDMISPFVLRGIIKMEDLSEWRYSASKWMRRSVPVSLIKPAKDLVPVQEVLGFIDPLMNDSEKVVHQGLGWLLREMWKKDPKEVEEFLLTWKDECARLIVQYATEKMKPDNKFRFRRSVVKTIKNKPKRVKGG